MVSKAKGKGKAKPGPKPKTSTKGKGKPKARSSTPKPPSQEAKQLAMFHNPFSRATKQPKIPDGKATESLGFQTQAVGEMTVDPDLTRVGPYDYQGVGHILLFPGQNSGMVFTGFREAQVPEVVLNATNADGCYTVPFVGSNATEWFQVGEAGGPVIKQDRYAFWRTVSQGLKLSLLNTDEENDGWWEAVRITEPMNPGEFRLMTTARSNNTNSDGTIVPVTRLTNYTDRQLVNENSYTTGLLKDLGKHVFSLHGLKDEHDLTQQQDTYRLDADDIDGVETTKNGAPSVAFQIGSSNVTNFINMNIDKSHDMIYIRIHGRKGEQGGNPSTPTRLHYNVVSNQEIIFGNEERESRFHTRSGNIASDMEKHIAAKRMNGAAAHRA